MRPHGLRDPVQIPAQILDQFEGDLGIRAAQEHVQATGCAGITGDPGPPQLRWCRPRVVPGGLGQLDAAIWGPRPRSSWASRLSRAQAWRGETTACPRPAQPRQVRLQLRVPVGRPVWLVSSLLNRIIASESEHQIWCSGSDKSA